MATRERSGSDDLSHLERLARDPSAHHIFLALRMIEAARPDAPRLGQSSRPRQDSVRLGQEPSMAFARSTLTAFTPPCGKTPGRLGNLAFGLFGAHGPMPAHLTEYVRERKHSFRDPTLAAFADMLTHRLLSLFYRAWTTGQPAPGLDRDAGDGMDARVAALSGHAGGALQGRDAMPDMARRYFTGHLARGPKNAAGLESMLAAFFRAPVRVQQFVGSWLPLEPDDRWQLGARVGLGQGTGIGDRVWSRSAKFRLHIGPLTVDEYRTLLPGGAALARLTAIVRSFAGDALDWDVNLVLRAAEVPRASLGGDTRLGQTGWIGTRPEARDADDLYLVPPINDNRAEGPYGGTVR
ncbi:type VI secretion system baseplate subunit TssG [Oceaniovalibus sp. ACAM 378]|uniref:type VI secretion system baseplate subunit TssG n=1 Tax=Oceaniovalibus sp. ACAM 378 TaxID=2599923 RepID=UPI0011D3F2A1|nr:type VI secretion system baseplate subunit TssG [Oceaniovalibus sp. ACAM 378]TYB84410.1 type VI secretion system baseplate subunit TssG [Oceaniovalibus sp. ACAM 378]